MKQTVIHAQHEPAHAGIYYLYSSNPVLLSFVPKLAGGWVDPEFRWNWDGIFE